MNHQTLVIVLLAVIVSATPRPYKEAEEHYPAQPYKYDYAVNDAKTGDQKSHHESRESEVVNGYYSLVEADGTLREVHYTADKHNGFNAVVKKTGTPIVQTEPDKSNQERHYAFVQNVHEPTKFHNR